MKRIGQIIGCVGVVVLTAVALWLRYVVVTGRELGIGFLLGAVGVGTSGIGIALYKRSARRRNAHD